MVAFCTADCQKLLETAVQPVQAWKDGLQTDDDDDDDDYMKYACVKDLSNSLYMHV